ncbi:MAG TPA: Rne/Rng family ribonuclease [Phycisphaerales bacterium]|nr:Rne/Rng family ribonuclease [Phycisphaerales bacterium]
MSETSMIINYVPGEECRVALVSEGNLEEFHAERTDAISRVNNIYVGRVTNVEAGIQAAFVDFGIEDNGFLHVSDLHPRYFGEDDATEMVGKKTPRRERPPIQHCLKRGQEVIVQVIKEGVGTKGPTLTSYLSIPGRYLVMMPQMDRVGVSRKVEDEEERRKMRDILSQLELPEGFGFILRTAGFDRNKTELKRDLAYLQRLWKDMEGHRKRGGRKPRLLYSESDLLVRALRDLVTPDVTRIIIDDEGALTRAAQFMKIVAPRSSVKLTRYKGRRPIFHAFGIEQQLALSHAREVPLPSGGRLVIDETEAIVAIDVNSGKSRTARDAETNAYKTNVEAVEAICRQLRLRDVGGIIINDLIDMRSAKNRKAIEQLMRDRLKRDRAKTTIAAISPFGILEMTRQRMRGSLRSQHFSECPTCRGKGLLQRPSSVASDALRELTVLLEHDSVDRVELVVSARVAGELLSTRRRSLSRIESLSGKQAQVRVSETLPPDRFTLYAYDAAGADINIEKLSTPPSPESELEVLETAPATEEGWAVEPGEETPAEEEFTPSEPAAPQPHPIELEPEEETEEGGRKKRRRRRRRKKLPGENGTPEIAGERRAEGEEESETAQTDEAALAGAEAGAAPGGEGEQPFKKKRRRRRRRRRGGGDTQPGEVAPGEAGGAGEVESSDEEPLEAGEPETGFAAAAASPAETEDAEAGTADRDEPETGDRQRKKRRRSRRKKAGATPETSGQSPAEAGADQPEPRAAAIAESSPEHPEPPAEAGTRGKLKGRRSGRKTPSAAAPQVEPKPGAREPSPAGAPARDEEKAQAAPKKPRTLYGAARRKLAPSEIPRTRQE